MLAKEVKCIIREVFETTCQDLGFRRTKRGGLGWYHPLDDHYFVITFRTPRGWNRHWGGFLECKMRIQDQINPHLAELRKPLECSTVSLASEADRETMRHWYNEAAARTTVPDETVDHLTALERELCEMLRLPLHAPLSAACDSEFLLRFRTEEDVRRWAKFILYRLPEWMEEMTARWRSWYGSTGRDMTPHQPQRYPHLPSLLHGCAATTKPRSGDHKSAQGQRSAALGLQDAPNQKALKGRNMR